MKIVNSPVLMELRKTNQNHHQMVVRVQHEALKMHSERSEPIAQDSSQQSLGHEYCDEQPAKNEPDDHPEKQAVPEMHDPLDIERRGNHPPHQSQCEI